MSITSSISDKGDVLTIKVQGRFDFNSLQSFRSSYEKVSPKPQEFIIDLNGSDYLDSSALGMLLALRDYAGGDSAKISVINCNADIKKILTITKLDELFTVK